MGRTCFRLTYETDRLCDPRGMNHVVCTRLIGRGLLGKLDWCKHHGICGSPLLCVCNNFICLLIVVRAQRLPEGGHLWLPRHVSTWRFGHGDTPTTSGTISHKIR